MIQSKCIQTGENLYSEASNIETHELTIDGSGFITFYDARLHKNCRTVLAWKHGTQEFIDFVEHEVNSVEIDKAI